MRKPKPQTAILRRWMALVRRRAEELGAIGAKHYPPGTPFTRFDARHQAYLREYKPADFRLACAVAMYNRSWAFWGNFDSLHEALTPESQRKHLAGAWWPKSGPTPHISPTIASHLLDHKKVKDAGGWLMSGPPYRRRGP